MTLRADPLARRGPTAAMDEIRANAPALTAQPDFREFWQRTLAELRAEATDIEEEPLAYRPYREIEASSLRFTSLGGARLQGYALRWPDVRPRPLVIHAHGYGGRSAVQWLWALTGVNVVGFDVRGFGNSFDAVPERSPWGYMLTGIETPETSVLRGAVCDYMRACQVGTELFGARTSRTAFHGYSFSAALALMSEAVTQGADLLAAGVPTFGWHEGRHRLVASGSAVETRRYIEARPAERERVMRTLSYFDTMNFAPLVRCPTVAGYGRRDEVVPAETVLAILGHLKCPCETLSMPVSHTDEPAESEWEYFDAAWMDAALHGVPAAFGTDPRVQHLEYGRPRWDPRNRDE